MESECLSVHAYLKEINDALSIRNETITEVGEIMPAFQWMPVVVLF